MGGSLAALFLILSLGGASLQASGWEQVSRVSPGRHARIVSQRGTVILYSPSQVYASIDDGRTWSTVSSTFPTGVFAAYTWGHTIGVFRGGAAADNIEYFQSTDRGRSWQYLSSFQLSDNDSLIDVCTLGGNIFAYTAGGSMYASWDRGYNWSWRRLPVQVGTVHDVAVASNLMMVCGSNATMWSVNQGETWSLSHPPVRVGSSIRLLREHNGVIWGGGYSGMCRFDAQSMAWTEASDGVPQYARITATPISLVNSGGVLFGCFRDGAGFDHVLRWSEPTWRWESVSSLGLPPQNRSGRGNLACDGSKLYLHVHGDDVNFLGVYSTMHQAPVTVPEQNGEHTITISPNPTAESAVVHLPPDASGTLVLLDASGCEVLRQQACPGAQTLNIAHLPTASYRLICHTAMGTCTGVVQVVR